MTRERTDGIDFSMNSNGLYREESFTDLQSGAVRRLVPVRPDGSPDEGRTALFIGTAQVLTPDGALPIQASLMANTLKEAVEAYPATMQAALQQMIVELEKIQKENPEAGPDSPRIVLPGRDF